MKSESVFLIIFLLFSVLPDKAQELTRSKHELEKLYINLRAETVADKTRGGLLGQLLGDLNGLRHEMKYINEPANVETYIPELPEGAWTDDDTDIEWIYLTEIQRTGILMLPPETITRLWKQHINRNIWCSHLYLRNLMDLGIQPPLTGKISVNPWADFNLSGQFLAETWGLISPGMPQTAARIGLYYTHVSIEGEPSQSTQMFATMISTAYLTSDIQRILAAGEAALDPESEFHRIIKDVDEWYRQNPNDWRATRKLIRDKYSRFGGQDMRDRNGVILNGAATIAALLYGNGDFTETVRLAFNFGWDCDNNAAMAGTILGVIKGSEWMMSQGWNTRDLYRNTTRDDMPMDETITGFGDRLIALAHRVIIENGGSMTTVDGKPGYNIRIEKPQNIEKIPDFKDEPQILLKEWRGKIEHAILKPGSDSLAWAAYLAICMDMSPEIRNKYPQQWGQALAELQLHKNVMKALFYESPVPAGDRLRTKAVESGLVKPEILKDPPSGNLNTSNIVGEKETPSLIKYRQQLAELRKEFRADDMPDVRFFLFGMGNRTKLLYKDGKLVNAINGTIIREWQLKGQTIIPNDYKVIIETLSNVPVSIFENEKGIFINENGKETIIEGTGTPVRLPAFDGYKYSEVLKVLLQEILINIVDSKPVPNYLVYKNPWRRDGAMMAMCLDKTGNIDLIRNWVLSLTDPYDRNNAGETEADNLGETLYLLSFYTDRNYSLVKQILAEIPKYEVKDNYGYYIKGRSDFHEAPVYQTKWLKFGLHKLGLEDPYIIPQIQDNYSSLFWWDYRETYMSGTSDAYDEAKNDFYPYIGWAADHFHGLKRNPVSDRDYPLTWEENASQADYKGMAIIDDKYVKSKISSPHTWHAAEVFLYLIESKK
jgi:hypothetical protein